MAEKRLPKIRSGLNIYNEWGINSFYERTHHSDRNRATAERDRGRETAAPRRAVPVESVASGVQNQQKQHQDVRESGEHSAQLAAEALSADGRLTGARGAFEQKAVSAAAQAENEGQLQDTRPQSAQIPVTKGPAPAQP